MHFASTHGSIGNIGPVKRGETKVVAQSRHAVCIAQRWQTMCTCEIRIDAFPTPRIRAPSGNFGVGNAIQTMIGDLCKVEIYMQKTITLTTDSVVSDQEIYLHPCNHHVDLARCSICPL
jgi:hypothetical protein